MRSVFRTSYAANAWWMATGIKSRNKSVKYDEIVTQYWQTVGAGDLTGQIFLPWKFDDKRAGNGVGLATGALPIASKDLISGITSW